MLFLVPLYLSVPLTVGMIKSSVEGPSVIVSINELATQEMGMATTNSAKLLVTRPVKEYSVFGSSQVPGSSFLNAIQTAHTNNSSATNPQGSAGVSMSADTNYWGLESMEPQHVHRREI
ncbi:hypothetical protein QZH41_004206 [Actinostola sp. cb2023]|nr:hypothetical protein QZH41_004206 [Actinostola sp. cb2023]